jgi:hypothetical protein
VIRVDMIRQDTQHPDKRRRHEGRASGIVDGRRYNAEGPAPIYRIATLLWLHGHGGEAFEVYDDRSPTGGPGGLGLTGRVRNYARVVKGKAKFDRTAKPSPAFSCPELQMIARAAGYVGGAQNAPPNPDNARTARSRVPTSPSAPGAGSRPDTPSSPAPGGA